MPFSVCSAVTNEQDGGIIIDASTVPDASGRENYFFITSKTPIKSCTGCTVEPFEAKREFINYKVIPKENIMKIR